MKTIIINGSPRINGDTAALISELKSELIGDIVEISAYRDNISPCIDCRYCMTNDATKTNSCCAIKDDMAKIYADDYDNLIVASPLYYGTLTGPLISLASRLQAYHAIQPENDSERVLKRKRGAVIFTGGKRKNYKNALSFSHTIFKILNVEFDENDVAFSCNTDTIPAKDDTDAISKVKEIARLLNNR